MFMLNEITSMCAFIYRFLDGRASKQFRHRWSWQKIPSGQRGRLFYFRTLCLKSTPLKFLLPWFDSEIP